MRNDAVLFASVLLLACMLYHAAASRVPGTYGLNNNDMTHFQHKRRHLLQLAPGTCVTTPQTNLGGTVLVNGTANLQSSSAACCQSCWGQTTTVLNGNTAKLATCNAWVWCGLPAGCDNGYGTVYPYQQCTLVFQASLQLPQPSITVASDVGTSAFTSGWIPSYSQAISETPTLSGYTRYPGVDYKQFYDYACGDVTASNDYCQQSGSLQAVAQKCMGDSTCSGFTYMPSQSMGWLKGGSRVSLAAVQSLTFATPNPDAVLYTRTSS